MKKSILKKVNDTTEVKFKSVKKSKSDTAPDKSSLMIEKDGKTKKSISLVVHEKNISQLLYLKGITKKKVEKLILKFKNQKSLDFENYKLMLYRNDLERCVMCLFRNREILKSHLASLYEKIKTEDIDTKKHLQCEINRHDLLLKQKEEVRNSLLKKDAGLRKKIGDLSEKCQKIYLERKNMKYQRDNLMQTIEKYKEEISMDETKMRQEIEYLSKTLKENKTIYEQAFSDKGLEIIKFEKKLTELLVKKNKLLSTISKKNEEAEITTNKKRQLVNDVNHLIKIRDELEERNAIADQQLEECYKQVTEVFREHETYCNIIKECHDKIAARKMVRETIILENNKLQEHLCNLYEKIGHNKRTIEALMKENDLLKERKEALCFKLESFECKHIQNKIAHKLQDRIELLRTVEILEQNLMNIDEMISVNATELIHATDEYNQVLEKVNEIEQIVKEKESEFLCLEKILKSKSRRLEFSKQNCVKLQDHVESKKEALKIYESDIQKLCKENERLSLDIHTLEIEIAEQQSIGESYKNKAEILQQEKTVLDEKILQLKQSEDKMNELKASNLELEVRLNTLKSNYGTVLNCLDTLRKIMEDQKERLDLQEAQAIETISYSYSYTECCPLTKNTEFE